MRPSGRRRGLDDVPTFRMALESGPSGWSVWSVSYHDGTVVQMWQLPGDQSAAEALRELVWQLEGAG